jgi:hypothetical protein
MEKTQMKGQWYMQKRTLDSPTDPFSRVQRTINNEYARVNALSQLLRATQKQQTNKQTNKHEINIQQVFGYQSGFGFMLIEGAARARECRPA